MPAVVNLQADNLRVEPGQTATCQMSLANTGTIVEQFTIMLLGDVAPWTEADPPVVSLFPGGQQSVTLKFSPPRASTTRGGEVPFAVKVIPSNEPDESVTEEGTITVGSFNDVGAELVPRVAAGRVVGRQKLAIDNRGNVPLPVEVTALDAANALKFDIRPDKAQRPPRARPDSSSSRSSPGSVSGGDRPSRSRTRSPSPRRTRSPLVLDGSLTQKAVLPKWVYAAVAVLAALVLLWFLVFRRASSTMTRSTPTRPPWRRRRPRPNRSSASFRPAILGAVQPRRPPPPTQLRWRLSRARSPS
jgi:hypothetical protein